MKKFLLLMLVVWTGIASLLSQRIINNKIYVRKTFSM